MGDTFGAITVPVGASADPLLSLIGSYLSAVLNANAQDGWEDGRYGDGEVVRTVFSVNPNGFVFDDELLPALFVYPPSGTFEQSESDGFENTTLIKVVWMLPTLAAETVDTRREFFRPAASLIATALRRCRDPLWQVDGDPEPTALNIAPDADSLVLPIATTLTPVTLSGAGLTGQLASSSLDPRLAPSVTTTPTGVDTYNTSAPVLFTVVDWYGRTKTLSKLLTKVRGGETLYVNEDVVRVTSITQPAHLSTVGSVSFGTGGFTGRGSLLKRLAGLRSIHAGAWRALQLTVNEQNGDGATRPARSAVYEALEVDVRIEEIETVDVSRFALGDGLDIDTIQGGVGGMVAQRSLPDP